MKLPLKTETVLLLIAVLSLMAAWGFWQYPYRQISLPPVKGMSRADLYFRKDLPPVNGVLLVCPGVNGNGLGWIKERRFYDFAKANQLGLVGLSFASDDADFVSNDSYYRMHNGSGKLLLQGLTQIYGQTPRLRLFGFSGGAQFVTRFAEAHPEQIDCWCAYAGRVSDPLALGAVSPPAYLLCGEADERLTEVKNYYQSGIAANRPWQLRIVPQSGHEIAVGEYPQIFRFLAMPR